jgi:hypothetical protein
MTKGPSGVQSISYTPVGTGSGLTNLDPLVEARYAAIAAGSELSSWIVSSETAEMISKLKVSTGSNQSLLESVEDGMRVADLHVLVHRKSMLRPGASRSGISSL